MKTKRKATQSDKVIGINIKKYRLLKKMSQEHLAADLGISFQQLQKYENGKNRVSASVLGKISQTLETPITLFFGNDDYYKEQDLSQNVENLLKEVDNEKLIKILARAMQHLSDE